MMNMNVMKDLMTMCALAGAVCFMSCSSSDDNEMRVNPDGSVRFTAAIGNAAVVTNPAPQSRASATTWDAGDDISVFMVAHGTADVANGAENRRYVTTAAGPNGNFTPATPADAIFYPMNNDPVDFIAFSYEDESKLTDLIAFNLSGTQTAATQAAADLLWAKADNGGAGYTKAAGLTVGLNFRHCLSKLTMKCKADDSVGAFDPDDVAVCIRNAKCYSYTHLSTGNTGVGQNAPARDDIIPRRWDTPAAGCFATYDAFLPPAGYTSGEMSVEFRIGADTYTWSVDAVTFGSGKEHIYEVLLTRTGVRVTGTIEDWTTVQGGNVTAE